MRARALLVALFCLSLGTAGSALAQGRAVRRAVVIEPAPIYLLPDATRTPLRTAPVNTQLTVLGEEGEWLRIEFNDPQFGPRVGYVQAKRVRILAPAAEDPARPRQPTTRQPPPARRPPPRGGIGFKAYGTFGSTSFAATDTFKAVAGSSTHRNFGGGAAVTGLWRGLFVDVGLSQTKVDGQRVFVDGVTVYELGIPLEITVTPIDVAAGWRVISGRLSTFLGGGVTSLQYEETSAFADPNENVNARKSGGLFLLGVDLDVVRFVSVGGDLRYRMVKGILGEGGASQVFGEDQVGGLSAAIRVSVGR